MRLFLAIDGDNIGRLVGKARLSDNVEQLRTVSQRIDKGNKIFESYALANNGSVIELGGDEVLIDLEASALKDLESVRNQYFTATNATVSVGIGKRPSEASKALLAAKLRGRNRSVFYDDDVEKDFNAISKDQEDPKQKLVQEYFAKNLAKRSNDSGGLAQPGQAQLDVITGNTLSVPAAPQTQETVNNALQNQAIPVPGQSIPSQAQTAIYDPKVASNTGSIRDFESQFRQHADNNEQAKRAESLKNNKNYQKIKEQVADTLENMKSQLPIIEQLKEQAPDAYQAIIDVLQSLVLVGKQLGDNDKRLEKSILDANLFDNAMGISDVGVGKSEDLIPGGKADSKKPEEFDPEQLAIGTQHELEHTKDVTLAQEIAMDHLTEDPNYYKDLKKSEDHKHDAISRELQYDGQNSLGEDKHYFINKSDNTKWQFIETSESESYASEAANNLASVIKDVYSKYPVFSYNLAGRHGIMSPYIESKQDLKEVKPQLLTSQEKLDLMVEFLIDWLVGNSHEDGVNLIRTVEGRIISTCKKDAFKDFDGIGNYYQAFMDSVKNGTIMFDLELLAPYFDIINSIDDTEYLENVGQYAQSAYRDDPEAQINFAKLLLLRKRNAQYLFTSLFKQELNKGERPEYGRLRARIKPPVGAVIYGKIKVRHWDGSESWKSIKSGAILGLDPGLVGEGHAVSAKNPGAK